MAHKVGFLDAIAFMEYMVLKNMLGWVHKTNPLFFMQKKEHWFRISCKIKLRN